MVKIVLEILKEIGGFCALLLFISYIAKNVYNARNNDYLGGLNGSRSKIHSTSVILISLFFLIGLGLSYRMGFGSQFIVGLILLLQLVYSLYEKDRLKNIIPTNELVETLVMVISPLVVGFFLGNTVDKALVAVQSGEYLISFYAFAFILLAFTINVFFVGTFQSHSFSLKSSLYFVLKTNFEPSILHGEFYKEESIIGVLMSEDEYCYYIKTEKNIVRIDKSNVAVVIKA